jgi:hypothetical protein
MRTILAFLRFLGRIWDAANVPFKVMILSSLAYPILILLVSLIGYSWITAFLAIYLVFAVIVIVTLFINPAWFLAVSAIGGGRRFLAFLGMLMGFELLFALYLVIVPVTSNYALVPVLVLIFLTLILLPSYDLDGTRKFVTVSRKVLICLAIGITMLFFLYSIFPSTLNAVVGKMDKWDEKAAAWVSGDSVKTDPNIPSATTPNNDIVLPVPVKKDSVSFTYHLGNGEKNPINLRRYTQSRASLCVSEGMVELKNSRCTVRMDSKGFMEGSPRLLGREFTVTALSEKADFVVTLWN